MRGEQIPRKLLLLARELFAALLLRKTTEADWQKFFAAHPYVLSSSLPLKLRPDQIVPQARPGKADPDFVFYPWDTLPIPYYGVVELKRPDSKIVTVTRSNVVLLSRDAETAIEQGKVYVRQLRARLRNANRSVIFLGNQEYVFVIMGLAEEISQKLGRELFLEQVESKFPKHCQLIPYDTLLSQFEAKIPVRVMILLPRLEAEELRRDVMDDIIVLPRIEVEEVPGDIMDQLTSMKRDERRYWGVGSCLGKQ